MDDRVKEILKQGNQLFEKRTSLLSLWQEIEDNFYPEREGFTTTSSLGTDFASNLTTSYPLLARRDLGNSLSSMLRRDDWFHVGTNREDREDNAAKRWLEWATKTQRNAMYDRATNFVRATKEGDHDFAAFGQCVISCELNRTMDALLYRCWHLRDVAWCEWYDGSIGEIHRKWNPTVRDLMRIFPGKVSANVQQKYDKDPYCEVEVRHVIMRADSYEAPAGKKWKTPWVSIYFEVATGNVLEELGMFNSMYVIPRWQTVSGSQYAYSPCTVAALPDARLIQAMTLVLLEAGEKAVNPPLVATQEVVRSDVQVFAGGITWVDYEYDERLGDALRPLNIDSRGIPLGIELRNDIKGMISDAFFLNKINMPPVGGPTMTAYEVGQRIQEYIRNAIPLFEPMEEEYNGALCEHTFDLMLRAGGFGSPEDIPQSIRGADIRFRFESPLHEAMGRQKGQKFQEARALLAEAAAADPSSAYMIDAKTALRDTLDGIGIPADWIRSEEEMKDIDVTVKQQQAAQQAVGMIQQGGEAAEQVGKAGQAIKGISQ